jgi:hypothetical protein
MLDPQAAGKKPEAGMHFAVSGRESDVPDVPVFVAEDRHWDDPAADGIDAALIAPRSDVHLDFERIRSQTSSSSASLDLEFAELSCLRR